MFWRELFPVLLWNGRGRRLSDPVYPPLPVQNISRLQLKRISYGMHGISARGTIFCPIKLNLLKSARAQPLNRRNQKTIENETNPIVTLLMYLQDKDLLAHVHQLVPSMANFITFMF